MPAEPEARVRARCAGFGFPGAKADTPVSALSGGEKARLLMGLAAFGGPHLLILDEPTNHLDIDSRAALMEAINDYDGAVILVSHDRFLIEACADRLWLVAQGTVRPFDGDLDDYRRLVLAGALRPDPREPGADAAQPVTRGEDRRAAAERRAAAAPLRKRLGALEARIERLTGVIAKVDAALADGAAYRDNPAKAGELARMRAEAARGARPGRGRVARAQRRARGRRLMLDTRLRRLIDPPLDRLGARIARRGIPADAVTVAGFALGAAAWAALALQAHSAALALILGNRLCDGLDGAVARRTGLTDRGAYLDVVLDFVFYAGVPFFFALGRPEAALPAAFLAFAFMGTAASFLAFAVFAQKRGLSTAARGRKSLYYLGGLTEGTETIALFVLICLVPSWFGPAAWAFGGLCWITTAGRIAAGVAAFSEPR